MLPCKQKISKIVVMEKVEIKQIADYLKDLEEGLYEWDYRGITTQGHLTKLYGIIERLIRSKIDTGIVVILDSRIVRKSYGAKFLAAIPKCKNKIIFAE